MHVINLSTYDVKGGAPRAAHRLHHCLQNNGCQSTMFVRYKDSNDKSIVRFSRSKRATKRLGRVVRRFIIRSSFNPYAKWILKGAEPFSDDRTTDGNDIALQLPDADIFHLHWIRNFVDIGCFFKFINRPIVWTLHDMNAFTGGCHYNIECERYKQNCGFCPQLNSNKNFDLSRQIWNRKQKAYRNQTKKLHIVAPSKWIAKQTMHSGLLKNFKVTVIPNGLDTSVFRPRGNAIRSTLGIPSEAKVILFVAHITTNLRKGYQILQTIFSEIHRKDMYLISVGEQIPDFPKKENHLHLGSISSDVLLSVIYSMADLFIIPSQQDNFPNTVLESFACGTPVVGFNVGGLTELIQPQLTGQLADIDDNRSLREALEYLIDHDSEREAMGKNCRKLSLEKYSSSVLAYQYKKLYQKILNL